MVVVAVFVVAVFVIAVFVIAVFVIAVFVAPMFIVIVVAFVTFALQHVHGDIVWQRETIVALGFDVKRDHAALDVGLVAMVIV